MDLAFVCRLPHVTTVAYVRDTEVVIIVSVTSNIRGACSRIDVLEGERRKVYQGDKNSWMHWAVVRNRRLCQGMDGGYTRRNRKG